MSMQSLGHMTEPRLIPSCPLVSKNDNYFELFSFCLVWPLWGLGWSLWHCLSDMLRTRVPYRLCVNGCVPAFYLPFLTGSQTGNLAMPVTQYTYVKAFTKLTQCGFHLLEAYRLLHVACQSLQAFLTPRNSDPLGCVADNTHPNKRLSLAVGAWAILIIYC